MKNVIKLIAMLICCVLMFANILPVSAETATVAETTTVEEKTTERETTPTEEITTEEKTTTDKNDDEISVTFENGEVNTQYIYTGKVIKPKLTVKKEDGSMASPDEYSVEYMSDSKSTGAHHLTVTYLKSGYKAMRRYDIIPGTTDKIDVKVKNGKVTVSWNPVPGAGVYRVYKYNEETGRYSEMWWSADEIASPKTSRTFTTSELKPGGKYKMGIMALPAINWMPTDQMAYFTVDTTKDTVSVQKPVTTVKPAEKTTNKANIPATTINPLEITTITEETGTTLIGELTTAIPDEEAVFESVVETLKTAEDNAPDNEKDNSQRIKLIIIIIAVIILAVAGIIFAVYKKKK